MNCTRPGASLFYRKLLANFTHLMAILLWVAGAMAFVAGMPQLGVAVWLVVLLNGAFSFWQEYKAERATEALRKLLPVYARVLREGQEQRIAAEELVPGDVMLLSEGDAISADGRLVQAFELRVDQSTLSGESRPGAQGRRCRGRDRPGTRRAAQPGLCRDARGRRHGTGGGICHRHGDRVRQDRRADAGDGRPAQPPAKGDRRSSPASSPSLPWWQGMIFFAVSTLVAGMKLLEAFIFAIGMIVAFVPEGLLPTVTLSLAMGVQRMVKRNAIVKRLSSVETLGCTSVICTDKTGTLTQNEMTVRELWVGGRTYAVTGAGYAPEGEVSEEQGAAGPAGDTERRRLCDRSWWRR